MLGNVDGKTKAKLRKRGNTGNLRHSDNGFQKTGPQGSGMGYSCMESIRSHNRSAVILVWGDQLQHGSASVLKDHVRCAP